MNFNPGDQVKILLGSDKSATVKDWADDTRGQSIRIKFEMKGSAKIYKLWLVHFFVVGDWIAVHISIGLLPLIIPSRRNNDIYNHINDISPQQSP